MNVRRFFLRADVNLDNSISMEEYLNLRSGTTAPGTFYTVFQLSNFNGNGQLTVDEFGNFYSQNGNTVRVQARFTRLDANADGFLTTSEWKSRRATLK